MLSRPTAIGQRRRQSPLYHQRLMEQITVGAFTARQRAVERGDMGGVGAECVFVCVWVGGGSSGGGGGGGRYSRMARQFAICCEKQTRNIQSARVQKTEWHHSASQARSWPEA